MITTEKNNYTLSMSSPSLELTSLSTADPLDQFPSPRHLGPVRIGEAPRSPNIFFRSGGLALW